MGILSLTFKIHRRTTGEEGSYLFTSHGGQTFLGKKFMRKLFLNGRVNDQIMPRKRRNFINGKFLFQYNLNNINLH